MEFRHLLCRSLENLTRFDVYLWQHQYFITLLNRRLLAPELQHSRVIFRSCKTAILPLYYNPRAIGIVRKAARPVNIVSDTHIIIKSDRVRKKHLATHEHQSILDGNADDEIGREHV